MVLIAMVLGCGGGTGAADDDNGDSNGDTDTGTDTGGAQPWCHEDPDEVDARVDALLAELTLDEKIGLMSGNSGILPADGLFRTPGVVSADLPGFVMVDGPRGVSKNAGNATAFPVGSARGATWDPALERQVGAAIALEARAFGASVLLAPTVNVLRHPRWGRAQESYGEDPLHVGLMGAAFVEGAQAQHVIASVKHFAANSIEDTRFTVNVTADERTLREIYLPAFRRIVEDAKVGSVMSAYNKVNGLYCGEQPHLLREVLKTEWGFQGFVESDWLLGTRSTGPAIEAGLDIEMPYAMFFTPAAVHGVLDAGLLDEVWIDDAVARIARTQWCFGLDSNPPVVDPSVPESAEHLALAREVAERAITLLLNRDDALPLDGAALGTIAVVGPLADVANLGDGGSSDVEPSSATSPLAGLQSALGDAKVRVFDWPLAVEDEAAFDAADAVIVFAGLTDADEGESLIAAGDRVAMTLPAAQETLIAEVAARHPKTIVVLEGGSSIVVESWLAEVEALLMAWYPGMRGGEAIASVLLGEVDPGGRSPVVWPYAEADLPSFDNVSNEVSYDRWHGYRHLAREGKPARFPFGFGLSYSSWSLAAPTLAAATVGADDTIELSVALSNDGARAGRFVVQIYGGPSPADADRPAKVLLGFESVALDAGESRELGFSIPVRELAIWDEQWRVPAGTYQITVAEHAEHDGPSVMLTVE